MEKRCYACKQTLPANMFGPNASKRDGLKTECKPCTKKIQAATYQRYKAARKAKAATYYMQNRDAAIARARAWEKANHARKLELRAAYRARSKEKIAEHSRIDRQKHNAKRSAKHKEWRVLNPEKCAEYVRARQTRKTRQMPAWADRAAILAKYAESRAMTTTTGVKHHVDHEIPLKGVNVSGLHVEYNLRVIPALLNQQKGNKN